jgi:peptide/nickel transport system substrate-binding protein
MLSRPALWPIWPGGPVSGTETATPEFDPGAAAKLLDAAGWMDSDKDGIRDKEGKQLHLVMIGSEKPTPKDASAPPQKLPRDYFIDAARRIGVVIEVKTGGESWVAKRAAEASYDLVEMTWSGMVDTDLTPLLGSKDPVHAPSAKIDRTLDAMGAAWDPEERGKLAVDLAAGLAESWSLAGIVAEAPQGLVHRRVKNVRVWDGWIDVAALAFDDRP